MIRQAPRQTRYRLSRTCLAALSIAIMAACSGGGTDEVGSSGSVDGLVEMTKGDANAPHTLIEYASTTCGACGGYHATMSETITELADAGKLHFIFRDFPRDSVDTAAFVLARCGGEDTYFDILDDIFQHQQGLLAAARNSTVRGVLETIGSRHGISKEAFADCLEDETIRAQITASAKAGNADGVTGTPTLFLDGRELPSPEGRTPESLRSLVDPSAAAQ